MTNQKSKTILLILSIILGITIAIAPILITGRTYDESKVMGSLLTGEFVTRTSSLILGLIVIYDGIKNFLK
ncbi:hypothetical protein [Niallia sp. 03133]|uniref:hypothetical protein n=1 Tax=Niallia sp. 03133 TaxID=3458060 RepID=UPI004044F7E5